MSKKLIQIGIVGIGFGQQVLVPAFRNNSRCVVKAICASTIDRASAVARNLEIEHAFDSWSDMVRDPALDAIAIATPAAVQAEIALAALKSRKHVFLEKPVAANLKGAQDLLDASEKAKVAHMVDFEFPELERWRRAKEILQRDGIGKLRHISVVWNVETFVNKEGITSWKADASCGGGALNNLVSHVLHYLEWFAGPIGRVSCNLASAPGDARPADSIVNLSLSLASAVSVSVSVCSCAFLGCGHRIEFFGDDGTLVLSNDTADHARGFRLFQGNRQSMKLEEQHFDDTEINAAPDGRIWPVSRLVDRFVTWIDEGTVAAPSLREGYRVQCLIEAAKQASLASQGVEAVSFYDVVKN